MADTPTPERQELEELRRWQELEKKASRVAMTHGTGPTKVDAWEEAKNVLKNIGTAAYKGVAGAPALAADVYAGQHDFVDGVMALLGHPERPLDKSMPVTRALEKTGYQPQTRGERLVNSTVRAGTGALIGPGGAAAPVRSILMGGLGGATGDILGEMPGIKGTQTEPYARVGGSLLGGVAGGMLTAPMRNAPQIAEEALRGISPQQLDAAARTMRQSQIAGLPLNLDQALGTDTNVTNLVKTLVARAEGQPLVDQLRQQPALAQALMERASRALPGQTQTPQTIANESQKLATQALTDARKARTNATSPLYENSGKTTTDTVVDMYKTALQAAQEAPNTNKAALYQQLANAMLDGRKAPITDIQKLNAAFRTQLNNVKNPNLSSTAGDREAVGALQDMVGHFRKTLETQSSNFAQANALYASLTKSQVNPLKQSVVGRVAGVTGALDDREAINKLLPLIAAGRDPKTPAAASEILKMADISRSSPEVFSDAVKTHITGAVANATKQSKGQLSPEFAGNVEKALLGNAAKEQGLKDALAGVARLNNLPENEVVEGFLAALKVVGASAKRPGTMGPDSQVFGTMARDSMTAGGLKMIGLAPGKPLARAVEGFFSRDAYNKIADTLTTPEGLATLRELAKTPIMSGKAQTIVNSLLAAGTAQKEVSGKNE